MADPIVNGLPEVSYYAPTFRIAVEGTPLKDPTLREILNLKVTMDKEQLTSFDFTIANPWHYRDDTAGHPQEATFKYSDTTLFDVGSVIHVEMGYADRLVGMMTGIITRLSPTFPESGPPTITVAGQDNLVKLKNRKPGKNEVKYYTKKKDWEIAEVIAKRNKLDFEATKDDPKAPQHDVVIQKNQSDAAFLMERAKRIDYDCYIVIGHKDKGKKEKKDKLFFVKPTDGRGASQRLTYTFTWGENLMSFTPTMNISDQVSAVTVRGWDVDKKELITATATDADLEGADKGKGTSGPKVVEARFDKKEELLVDWPVQSKQEAKALAVSLLSERAYRFLTASGQAIGLPDMRPGDNVFIEGIGKRFSGQYYVQKVVHSIGNNGYVTNFEVRRTYAEIPKEKEPAK
jgi:phage protein D